MKGFIVFLIMLLSCGKIFSQNTFAETDGVYIGTGFNVGWGGGLGNVLRLCDGRQRMNLIINRELSGGYCKTDVSRWTFSQYK